MQRDETEINFRKSLQVLAELVENSNKREQKIDQVLQEEHISYQTEEREQQSSCEIEMPILLTSNESLSKGNLNLNSSLNSDISDREDTFHTVIPASSNIEINLIDKTASNIQVENPVIPKIEIDLIESMSEAIERSIDVMQEINETVEQVQTRVNQMETQFTIGTPVERDSVFSDTSSKFSGFTCSPAHKKLSEIKGILTKLRVERRALLLRRKRGINNDDGSFRGFESAASSTETSFNRTENLERSQRDQSSNHSEYEPPKRVEATNFIDKPFTRAQGRALDLPNVQESAIERKRKLKKIP